MARKRRTHKRRANPKRYRRRTHKRADNPIRRRRRSRKSYRRDDNPIRRRRRYSKRRSYKRSDNPIRHRRKYRRRRNTWFGDTAGHRKASRWGWSRRRRGATRRRGRRHLLRSPWTNKIYRQVSGYRKAQHHYPMWRNPGAVNDIILPLALGTLGMIGAAFLVKQLPASVTAPLTFSGKNWAPVIIPIAAAVALMFLTPKVKALAPYSKYTFFAALGLGLAGAFGGARMMLATSTFGQQYLAGYTVRSMSSYHRRPLLTSRSTMNGYVRKGTHGSLGQVPQLTAGAKPYGVALPADTRRSGGFTFQGVYGNSVYEG